MTNGFHGHGAVEAARSGLQFMTTHSGLIYHFLDCFGLIRACSGLALRGLFGPVPRMAGL